ncbi:hypothetical protein [Methylobacterium trifolii]|uniref:Anti-sigma factor NepR domain-containing protein n=1 Tax=Methylobacterium trifolii TaxID=1003092 RepID=A0ABQ4TVP6_9HYPH|nr:hypothetical protein [Methylobacterium trifolii]GJE57945.1 hypothetical protein MPOCJGCO_0021 [Methylobacterium trifolii]
MSQTSTKSDTAAPLRSLGGLGIDTRHLGQTLRTLYEGSVDRQPIPDSQVDLLLRLRQKERDRRRAG